MKRIICLILAILLLTPMVAAADAASLPTITVTLSAKATKVGDTVRVTASVQNAPICASYHIIYSYDTAVLKPIEGKNINTAGIFTTNINPKDVGTINTVAADSSKVMEGNVDLFYTDFKVIAAPASGANTPLKFTYLEFYTPEFEKLVNISSNPCSIPIIGGAATTTPSEDSDAPANPEPEVVAPTNPADPTDTPTETPSDTTAGSTTDTTTDTTTDGNTDPGAATVPPTQGNTESDETSKETAKEEVVTLPEDSEGEEPTGDWVFDEEKQEVTVTDPDGNKTTYTYDVIFDPETNEQSGVVLYEEDGEIAGTLKTDTDSDGNVQVIKQFMHATSSPLFFIIPIALAFVACVGLIVFILIKRKKEANHE